MSNCDKGSDVRTTREIFEEWGQTDRADDMAGHHWGRVKQAFNLINESAGKYLEIGVGNGYGVGYMAGHQFARGQCLGLDLAANMVARARQNNGSRDNVTICQGDFLTMDLGAQAPFAVIFSMEVFYYFSDIQQGIDKAFSLLEPGGQLWVLVDYYRENQASHTWPDLLHTPMTLWSEQDYLGGFKQAGFTQIEQHRFRDERAVDEPLTLATTGKKFK